MTPTEKPLKASKSKIVLRDGRELQFHVPPPLREGPLDLRTLIPAEKILLEVEIGPGKGEFLARRAGQHPERFFVGIDRRKDRKDLTERKMNRLGLNNGVVIQIDARRFLQNDLPPIQTLHVYHPDPWPKARHHKHRFFRSPDARRWAEAIISGGELRFSTDHRGYFEEIVDILATWDFLEPTMVWKKDARMGTPMTHFEGIFLRKGEPVFKATYRRR
jgi:tRNA (guanine-N7-)-methyltransferase